MAFLDVFLSVLREEDAETALIEEGGRDVFGAELLDFPVIDGGVVPRLVFAVLL
jgi:hypothetical protein